MTTSTATLAGFFLARIEEDPMLTEPDRRAKRRIAMIALGIEAGAVEHPEAWVTSEMILGELASVYADHPDFDPAWRS